MSVTTDKTTHIKALQLNDWAKLQEIYLFTIYLNREVCKIA